MNAAYAAASRSLIRSSAAAPRIASNLRPAPSPFRMPKQNNTAPCSRNILRSPLQLSSSAQSMFPHHTLTASALLNSLLSGTQPCYAWNLQDL